VAKCERGGWPVAAEVRGRGWCVMAKCEGEGCQWRPKGRGDGVGSGRGVRERGGQWRLKRVGERQ
jgi:hypothetical protein